MSDVESELERALGSAYRLSGQLQGGGSAHVFAAEEIATGRRVVIKVLPYALTETKAVERFRREVQLAATLTHPHIVPVLRAEQSGELLYYVMPFAGQSTLRTLMGAKRQLAVADALRIAGEVASALTYAHSHNVLHRDIKPENILIDDGRALVADFGIARAIERAADAGSVTSTGLTLGTPLYMSPEQAAGNRDLDGRSDIYSLACVVYEMLAGEPPFTSESARTLVAKHINEPPPSVLTARPDIPPHIDQAIRAALSKSPADRFASPDAFVAALRTPSPAPVSVAAVQKRRRRGGMVTAALAALAIVAWKVWPSPTAVNMAAPVRIAVLNFETATPGKDLEFLARAVTTDVIDVLRRAPEFVPLSYEAIRSIPGDTPLDSLREKLRVRAFVTGSLENIGDSIRVIARIIDADSLTERGRKPIRVQFARSMILQLRDSVVDQVGRVLLTEFGREAQAREWRGGTRSAPAWELRQRAQDLIDGAGALPRPQLGFAPQLAALARADSLLVAASALDPSWPEPYVTRGWLRSQRTMYEGRSFADAEFQAAESLATRALRVDREYAPAFELRGNMRLARTTIFPKTPPAVRDSAEVDLRTAIRLDENMARAWQSLASVLRLQGDSAGATDADKRAQQADPYSRQLGRVMQSEAIRQVASGQGDSARATCHAARARFPDDAIVRICELSVLGWIGRGSRDLMRAEEELQWHEAAGPVPLTAGMYVSGRFWIAAILARTGARDTARALVRSTREQLRAAGFATEGLINEAQVLTELGDYAGAIGLLEKAAGSDTAMRRTLGSHPWFSRLRKDPRFRSFVK